jgi:integrase
VNQVRARLRSVFQQAVIDQLLFVNPAIATKRVKDTRDEEDKPGQALEPAQVTRFVELGTTLHAAGVAKLWPALFCSISLGLRRGEILGLRWVDIDLENRTLNVRQNLTQERGKLVLGKPKTPQSIREIPLVSSEVTVLTAHFEASQREAEAVGRAWSNLTPVFATVNGTHTEPRNLQAALKSLLAWSDPKCEREQPKLTQKQKEARAGKVSTLEGKLRGVRVDHRALLEVIVNSGEALPNLRLHDLRHTAGTMMLQRKMPVEVVSRILGHASISITLDVYRHVSVREVRLERVDVFDQPLPVREVPVIVVN